MLEKNLAIRKTLGEVASLNAELEALKAELKDVKAELAAEKDKHRWIPVNERLPKDIGTYMTRSEWSKLGVDVWVSPRLFNGKHWDLYNEHITHWQPLPSFYEEDL